MKQQASQIDQAAIPVSPALTSTTQDARLFFDFNNSTSQHISGIMHTTLVPSTLGRGATAMAGHPSLAHTPLQAISKSLVSVATGMRASDEGFAHVLDLTPNGVARKFIDIICQNSPTLGSIILTCAPFCVLGYGFYKYVYNGFGLQYLVDKIKSRFMGKVTIPGDHELHKKVLNWVSKHGSQDTQSLTLHSGSGWRGMPSQYEVPIYQKPELSYVPAIGSSHFEWNGYTLYLHRDEKFEPAIDPITGDPIKHSKRVRRSDMVISAYSPFGGVDVVKAFLRHVNDISAPEVETLTSIYRISRLLHDGELWDRPVSRTPRCLDSVAMEAAVKDSLIEDLTDYLSPQSKAWYADRGIPWRRGYLLYGPPGTGKTSFATATAGHFNLTVFIIAMTNPDLNDDRLEQLFDNIPNRCLVLIEDVDSAGIKRENMKEPGKHSKTNKKSRSKKGGVTLSGLLNVIDGVCSAEGRVLMLTSNSPDNLDPALIRPGRIDKQILFGNASYQVMEKMFLHIFSSAPGEKKSLAAARERVNLSGLATEFADQLPEGKFSPAEIQNFLLEHRDDPSGAVAKVGEWAENLLRTKEKGRNVAAFTGQIGEGTFLHPLFPHQGQTANVLPGTTDDGVLVEKEEEGGSSSSSEAGEEGAMRYTSARRPARLPPPGRSLNPRPSLTPMELGAMRQHIARRTVHLSYKPLC